jgi:uncharacterized phage protein (TIGR01671 family)
MSCPQFKYRAKRKDNNEWVYGYFIQKEVREEFENGCGCFIYTHPYIFDGKQEYEIWLYTLGVHIGKKDENGKEIYTGDILTSKRYPYQDNGIYSYHAEVFWSQEDYAFCTELYCVDPSKQGICNGLGNFFEDLNWEIIGNIVDNHDLLEPKM